MPFVNKTVKDGAGANFTAQFWDDGSGNLIAAHLMVPSESYVGKLGAQTEVVTAVPVTSTTAYASADCMGGKLTFSNIARVNGGTGIIQMAQLFCKTAQTFMSELYLFHTDPSASTFTDNGAFAINVADFDKLVGKITMPALESIGTPSFSQFHPLGIPFKAAAGSRDLFGVLVVRGAPTLASTSDLKIALKALLD